MGDLRSGMPKLKRDDEQAFPLLMVGASFLLGIIAATLCASCRQEAASSVSAWRPPESFVRRAPPQAQLRADWVESEKFAAGAFSAEGAAIKPDLPQDGVVYLPWLTPIFRVNIRKYLGDGADPKILNDGLLETVTLAYEALLKENKEKMAKWDTQEKNHFFFMWQTEHGGWTQMMSEAPEWEIIKGVLS